MKVENIIKLILSVLLLVCVLDMPYGYYQLIRFIALLGFAFLSYQANKSNRQIEMLIYIALALLFQPIFKVSLGRQLWNIVDVVVGISLLVTMIKRDK
jgi:hypothetical protein